ncbi:DUF7689 domain-containing protein [Singulisphaera acidiphila]|uniref:DUF7689 domain-containing protein n=1 Tax=Singulisphaera acidiphila (strain ATCC BAA-1392 / DSM 18658 / VKM B-2454 / MOB10) TaxID=886293 RepID=L0DED7_SINAD|nr:hypothetical protein [Singulisphaera acidiphila]AGA27188.1 hypothetical protein Sinac_2901 [Singulisphaera acidiphila DSM 18658]
MEADENFPRLTPENHRVTSPAMIDYNCIAWAAGDTERWWEPGVFWPIVSPPDEYGIGILETAFKSLGFEACNGEESDPGFEKIAIYGNNLFYTHAARQLPTGKWTSKLGKLEDIEHDTPDVVAGGIYGDSKTRVT